MAFEAADYYAIEELLTEEERVVRDTARRFVEEEFQPHIVEAYRNGTFPMQLVPRIAELGFFGPTLPEEYGCAGASSVASGLISQERERGDPGRCDRERPGWGRRGARSGRASGRPGGWRP